MPRFLNIDPTDTSVPLDLEANAQDYLVLMKVAFSRKLYAQVAHMGHLATELAFKAAFAKKFNGAHPKVHDLPVIASYEFSPSGRTFFDELTLDPRVFRRYNLVKTAWYMQYRYLRRAVDKPTAILYKTGFREVVRWTLKNYV